MLLTRWLKRSAFMNRKLRQYVGYAAGEILLVIAGILIALQIDNWNSGRQDAATLDNYLQSISRNMRDDAEQLERLHAARSDSIMRAHVAKVDLLYLPVYSVEQVQYLAAAMRLAESAAYFNANTSSFDALKNSGVLDGLQGKDIEELLSRYYVGVARVGQIEEDLVGRIRVAMSLPRAAMPAAEGTFAVEDPTALAPGRFEELQPYFRAFFASEYPDSLFTAAEISAAALREYEKLLSVSRLFVEIVEAGTHDFDANARRTLAEVDAIGRGAGYADVIRDGVLSVGYYNFLFGYPYYVDGVFSERRRYVDFNSVRSVDGAFRFTFKGGTPWAVFSLSVRENDRTVGRAAADFTRFDRLLVEAKGANGGERLLLHLKDKNDPDDGMQTNIEVVLGKDWEAYEFALSEFETADLSALHLALGFLMLNQESPVSFSIRTVKFLKPAGQESGGADATR
jgi:hypothetical protein